MRLRTARKILKNLEGGYLRHTAGQIIAADHPYARTRSARQELTELAAEAAYCKPLILEARANELMREGKSAEAFRMLMEDAW